MKAISSMADGVNAMILILLRGEEGWIRKID
jgi:hypothetical protein